MSGTLFLLFSFSLILTLLVFPSSALLLIVRAREEFHPVLNRISSPKINEFPFLYSCNGVILKPVLRLLLDLTCFIDVLVPTHLIKPLYHKVNNKNECEICACSLPLYTNISLEKTL